MPAEASQPYKLAAARGPSHNITPIELPHLNSHTSHVNSSLREKRKRARASRGQCPPPLQHPSAKRRAMSSEDDDAPLGGAPSPARPRPSRRAASAKAKYTFGDDGDDGGGDGEPDGAYTASAAEDSGDGTDDGAEDSNSDAEAQPAKRKRPGKTASVPYEQAAKKAKAKAKAKPKTAKPKSSVKQEPGEILPAQCAGWWAGCARACRG